MQLWDAIADERRRLADLLETLTAQQLDTQSLCEAWTVNEVAAHVVATVQVGIPRFAWTVIVSAGDMHKASRLVTAQIAARPVGELAGTLREKADYRAPLRRPEGPLADLLVHSQDIRRPLGLSSRFPRERITTVLQFLTERKAIGFVAKGVVSGLAWQATDLTWAHGSGPAVRGPGEALMMALTGRVAALDDLEGDGLPILRGRLG